MEGIQKRYKEQYTFFFFLCIVSICIDLRHLYPQFSKKIPIIIFIFYKAIVYVKNPTHKLTPCQCLPNLY